MTSYVYLHGFASSPASSKARYFQQRLAERSIELHIPELDAGDFEHLTLTGQLRTVEKSVGGKAAVLFGSSMGGYLAAIHAANHPNIERLVLLAPAFNFYRRWTERTGEEQLDAWRSTRTMPVYHYGTGRERQLDYGLYEDAAQYPPFPDVRQPALVMHGRRDDVVPVEAAEQFCALHPNAVLRVFDAGHELTEVLGEMWTLTEEFLFTNRS